MTEKKYNQPIPLHDYQIYAKNFLLTHPYCGLFLQVGLGKTSIVLEALMELNPVCHVLIIAPKHIARATWTEEMRKWGLLFRTQSLLVNEKGKNLSKQKREELYASITSSSPTVYFINRELIPDLVKHFPGKKWPFPIVVIDESQSFKSHTSQRWKALKTVRPFISRMVLLTGSPAPKSLLDLWAQIYLLDMGDRLGKYITVYRHTYFMASMIVDGYPVAWIPLPNAEPEIYRKISDIVISMKNHYIKLPEITYTNLFGELSESENKLYKEFMKTKVLDLDAELQITASNAGVLSAKLSQMASGAIYRETGSSEYEKIHEHKLELCEYVINNTDSPLIIAYRFKSDKDMIESYLSERNIPCVTLDGSPEMVRAWNEGKYPVMLLQPQSCGRGLNLQKGGHTLVWYTIPWSLEDYEQTIGRIYRQGQSDPVVIIHLIIKGTIDTKILRSIENKDLSQQRLMKAVEAVLIDNN